ncbi:hypothetical protein F4861DRAFT_327444 [Xylaria intraflava]|nr:hypothetical protein F4861DRAFT_327444 [Xylaria intraflava]
MVAPKIIRDWIESVDYFTTASKRSQPHDSDEGEHSAKRHLSDALACEVDMSSTPPRTDPNTSAPHKRQHDGLGMPVAIQDVDATPKAPSRSFSGHQHPKKRAKTTLSSLNQLAWLEKPVSNSALPDCAALPTDVQELYKDIELAAEYKQHIIPHEVRNYMMPADGNVPEYSFRAPAQLDTQSHPDILNKHEALRSIVRSAKTSDECDRSEAGWNHHVHTPLLSLVFGSDPLGITDAQSVVARFEAVMTATVVGSAIPSMQPSPTGQPQLAYSVSADSDSDSDSSSSTQDSASVDVDTVHSCRGSKKVDYVLVLYISQKTALYQVIKNASFESRLGYGFVNQTLQSNLLYNPIAASIKTKISSSREDPLVQLSLWTAAWHKRMYTIHDRIVPPTPQSYLATNPTPVTPRRTVSLPLILVIAHEWYIYFACDLGSSICIYGRMPIGSTRTIASAYSLVTCLEHVKRWIETTFYNAMKLWFMSD